MRFFSLLTSIIFLFLLVTSCGFNNGSINESIASQSVTATNKYDEHFVDYKHSVCKYPSYLENLTVESKNIDSTEEIDKYNKFYVSKDAPDFEITNYKDGVCINRYVGKSDYVEIPEKIAGKPVLKLGLYKYQINSYEDGSTYTQHFSIPFLNHDVHSLLSECDYIENSKTYSVCYDASSDEFYGFHKNLCIVKKIKIPKTVECISNVGDYTVTFEVDEENPYFSSIDGSLCSKDETELYSYNHWKNTVTIPDGIVTVYNKSLPYKKVYIPESVKEFYGFNNFKKCIVDNNNKNYKSVDGSLLSKDGKELIIVNQTLDKIIVPESVEKILNPYAFSNNYYVRYVKISKNVKFISKDVLINMESSHKIIVDKENKWFCSKGGNLYSKDMSTLFCAFDYATVKEKTTKVYINNMRASYVIEHDNVDFVLNVNENKKEDLPLVWGSRKIKEKLKKIGIEHRWADIKEYYN